MQEKFINQSKIVLIVSLACYIFCIIYLPTNIVISVFTFYTWLKFTITSTKLYIYIYGQGRRQDFGSKGGNIGQKFINDFRSSPAMASQKFRFGGKDIQQKCTNQRLLKNFEKFIKNLHKNLINSPKFFKKKI